MTPIFSCLIHEIIGLDKHENIGFSPILKHGKMKTSLLL